MKMSNENREEMGDGRYGEKSLQMDACRHDTGHVSQRERRRLCELERGWWWLGRKKFWKELGVMLNG